MVTKEKEKKQGELCPECKQFIGTNTMCSDCARFRKSKEVMTSRQISLAQGVPFSGLREWDNEKWISLRAIKDIIKSFDTIENRRYNLDGKQTDFIISAKELLNSLGEKDGN
jgi:hypothetical protein